MTSWLTACFEFIHTKSLFAIFDSKIINSNFKIHLCLIFLPLSPMNENECETQGKQTGLMFGKEYKSSLASRTRTLIFTGMRRWGMRISRTVSQTSPFSSSRSRPANICSWFGDRPVVHKDWVITCLALTRTP